MLADTIVVGARLVDSDFSTSDGLSSVNVEQIEEEYQICKIDNKNKSHSCSSKPFKNLFGISFSFLIAQGIFFAEVSLQSSVNVDSGLGLTSLCVLYFFFILSCLYSATLMRLFGTKYTIVVAYVGATIYTLANFYPSWYTLMFVSIVYGSVIGPLWAAQSVHITTIAHQYANMIGEEPRKSVFLFFGIYTFIFKLSYLPANTVSSVVLLNGRSPNSSSSLSEVCNNTEAAIVDIKYLYILLSIYFVFDIVSILILVLLVDNIPPETNLLSVSKVFHEYIKQPVINTLKHLFSWEINMITIMMILDGYSISFVFGLFSKVRRYQ